MNITRTIMIVGNFQGEGSQSTFAIYLPFRAASVHEEC